MELSVGVLVDRAHSVCRLPKKGLWPHSPEAKESYSGLQSCAALRLLQPILKCCATRQLLPQPRTAGQSAVAASPQCHMHRRQEEHSVCELLLALGLLAPLQCGVAVLQHRSATMPACLPLPYDKALHKTNLKSCPLKHSFSLWLNLNNSFHILCL